jgi:hypothetical protein
VFADSSEQTSYQRRVDMATKKKSAGKSAKPKAKEKQLKDLDTSEDKNVKGGALKRARRTDDTSSYLRRR